MSRTLLGRLIFHSLVEKAFVANSLALIHAHYPRADQIAAAKFRFVEPFIPVRHYQHRDRFAAANLQLQLQLAPVGSQMSSVQMYLRQQQPDAFAADVAGVAGQDLRASP